MTIKTKIHDAKEKRSEWLVACNDPTVLRKTGKTREEAAGILEFYEGRFDVLMEILNEGLENLSQKSISIKQYEADTKIKTWSSRCSNPTQLLAIGKTAEEAGKLVKYFEGKQSALQELEKEI